MIKNLLGVWLLWGLNARLMYKACISGGPLSGLPQESKRAFKCLW
jgi:hypothetical protein